jgi:hypothetical protein
MYFDRTGGQRSIPSKQYTQTKEFKGPVLGWISSNTLGQGPSGGAELLLNIIPTRQGGRVRGGRVRKATISLSPDFMVSYNAGVKKFFAADATAIYDITAPPDPPTNIVTPVITGQTSGDWSASQFTPGSGQPYLTLVNGFNDMQQFDGEKWLRINAATAGGRAITGIATSSLSHVWHHQKRMWFIEKTSMSAWYLPVLQIAGALVEFPLGSVFKKGGELLFGASWSTNDAGDGLDDKIAFFTSRGEVAVYAGIDPGSDFSLQQVYQMGTPLHKNAHFRGGGDIVVLTDEGIVPLSAATALVGEGLLKQAVTRNIEDGWKAHVQDRKGLGENFSCVLWPDRGLLYVGLPNPQDYDERSLVCHSGSGAWGEISAWPTRCCAIHDGRLYIGSPGGGIWEVDTTGADDGQPYQAIYIPSYNAFNSADEKSLVHARYVARGDDYEATLFGNVDFTNDIPFAGTPIDIPLTGIWDESEYDTDSGVWQSAADLKPYKSEWQTVTGFGNAISVGMSVTIGQVGTPIFEIVRIDTVYHRARLMS